MTTPLVLDALEQVVWVRERTEATVNSIVAQVDRASQHQSLRYAERLAEAGIAASVGTTGDSYDNAFAETINGRCKTELIKRRGPSRPVDHVDSATAEYLGGGCVVGAGRAVGIAVGDLRGHPGSGLARLDPRQVGPSGGCVIFHGDDGGGWRANREDAPWSRSCRSGLTAREAVSLPEAGWSRAAALQWLFSAGPHGDA